MKRRLLLCGLLAAGFFFCAAAAANVTDRIAPDDRSFACVGTDEVEIQLRPVYMLPDAHRFVASPPTPSFRILRRAKILGGFKKTR